MQKRHVLVCEGSLYPRKLSDVSGPGLGEAGRYTAPPPGDLLLREEAALHKVLVVALLERALLPGL